MVKKTITYTDYNGVERTETFYFNFTETEIIEMEYGTTVGMIETVQKIINAKDEPALINIWKEFILKAYGEKSPDGRLFMKEDENGRPLANKFKQTEAYSKLFMELASDSDAASKFVNGLIPNNS